MPSSSTLSGSDKNRVRSVIQSPIKILAASLARIYFAYPDPFSWTYGGLQGALVLVADRARSAHFLCLVDLLGTRGVIWDHEIYKDFEYNQDRPFFHSFAGDVRVTAQLHATLTDLQREGVHGRYRLSCRGRCEELLQAGVQSERDQTCVLHMIVHQILLTPCSKIQSRLSGSKEEEYNKGWHD
jgi:WH1 domain